MKTYSSTWLSTVLVTICLVHGVYADFAEGDPVIFRRDTFYYQRVSPRSLAGTALTNEPATVRSVFNYRRDPAVAPDPSSNPEVQWVTAIIERNPPITYDFPLEDGTSNGPPIIPTVPTGTFPPPTMQPFPTIVRGQELVTVTIAPVISHQIKFKLATQIHKTSSEEPWTNIGDIRELTYEKGKNYSSFLRLPEELTQDITTSTAFDLRTIIYFGETELDRKQHTGAIIVKSLEPFQLIDCHVQGEDFVALLTGATVGTTYNVETSTDVLHWNRVSSFYAYTTRQSVQIPIEVGDRKFLRVSYDP